MLATMSVAEGGVVGGAVVNGFSAVDPSPKIHRSSCTLAVFYAGHSNRGEREKETSIQILLVVSSSRMITASPFDKEIPGVFLLLPSNDCEGEMTSGPPRNAHRRSHRLPLSSSCFSSLSLSLSLSLSSLLSEGEREEPLSRFEQRSIDGSERGSALRHSFLVRRSLPLEFPHTDVNRLRRRRRIL